MNIAWDRRTHNWDDEIILRTMMLGDIDNYRDMTKNISQERLQGIFEKKYQELDPKSATFWGHKLGCRHTKTQPFIYRLHVSSTPSRHITT